MLQHKIREAFCALSLATRKGISTYAPVTLSTLCAGAASTYQRWRLTLGSHASRRISSIRRLTIKENRLWMMAGMGGSDGASQVVGDSNP
jgi:hypothetical protein